MPSVRFPLLEATAFEAAIVTVSAVSSISLRLSAVPHNLPCAPNVITGPGSSLWPQRRPEVEKLWKPIFFWGGGPVWVFRLPPCTL